MFNIYLKSDKEDINVNENIYYIVAKDGIYLRKNLDLTDSLIKVCEIPFLEEIKEYSKLKIKKIKMKDFTNIVNFLREVMKKYSCEGILILYYNYKTEKYAVFCPDQTVYGAHVTYENIPASYFYGKDYVFLGTIHSHPGRSAWHSRGDTHDEEKWDGLHLTIGGLSDNLISISCSIMSNGKRYIVDPSEYIENIEKTKKVDEDLNLKLNDNELEKFKNDNITDKNSISSIINFSGKVPEYQISFNYDNKLIDEWLKKVIKYENKLSINEIYKRNQLLINSTFFDDDNNIPVFDENIFRCKYGNIEFSSIHGVKFNKKNLEKSPCDVCIHRQNKINLLVDEFDDFMDEMDNEFDNDTEDKTQ